MNLEKLKYKVKSFTKNDKTLELVIDNLFSILEEINHDNIVAFINELDESEHRIVDICDMRLGEDFEFVDPTYSFDGDNLTYEQLDEKEEELEDQKTDLETEVDDAERLVEEIEEDGGLDADTRASELESARHTLETKKKELKDVEDLLEELEESRRNGPNTPHGWVNKVHLYEDGINTDVANQSGLEIIKFTHAPNEDEEAIMIGGGGMDLSYSLMLYEALTYGAMRSSLIDRLNGINYSYHKSLMGETRWAKFIERLGIPPAADEAKTRATAERLRRLEESFDQLAEMNKDPKNRELVMASALAIAATTN
jgi:hypothetical protein